MTYSGSGAPPGAITYVLVGDSAATIQAKLDSVQAGNSLVFTAGTYDFAATTIAGRSGVTVWADGQVVINNAPGANTHGAFDFSGRTDWTIGGKAPGQGFVFNGSLTDATNASGNGTIGNSQFNSQQSNGYDGSAILGTQRAAIEVGPASSGSEYFSGLVVDNNYFDNFNNTADAGTLLAISLVGQSAQNTTITNNFIRRGPADAGEVGVAIEMTGTGVVSGNTIVDFSYAVLTYQSGWSVYGNVVYNDGSSPYFGFANSGSSQHHEKGQKQLLSDSVGRRPQSQLVAGLVPTRPCGLERMSCRMVDLKHSRHAILLIGKADDQSAFGLGCLACSTLADSEGLARFPEVGFPHITATRTPSNGVDNQSSERCPAWGSQ